MGQRTQSLLPDALPELLAERLLTLRALACELGVNQSYLSRILGAKPPRPVSGEIAARVAAALDLPRDYFPEYRQAAVIEAVKTTDALRERFYEQLPKTR